MPDSHTPNEMKELRQGNPWLDVFGLSDEDFYQVIVLSSRAIIGSDSLDVFYQKMLESIKKDRNSLIKIIEAVVNNRFLPHKDEIEGLDDFIRKLGGDVAPAKNIRETKTADTAKMVFSSTDEEEIKSLPKLEHKIPSADDYMAQAQVIIKDFGFKDKDEVIIKRLQNFVVAKLRDVRDDMETLEVLTKGRKIGGIELDEEKARFLLKLIKDKESGFRNGEVPAAEPAAKPKIEFPVYQEMPKEKVAAIAGDSGKPLTLEEKRKKDGFVHSSPPYQGGDKEGVMKDILEDVENFKEVAPSDKGAFKTPPNLPPAYGGTGSERGGKNASIQDLPSKDEVYPIIEEEDGLPVIRMPEEMVAAPRVLPPQKVAAKPEAKAAFPKEGSPSLLSSRSPAAGGQGISWENEEAIQETRDKIPSYAEASAGKQDTIQVDNVAIKPGKQENNITIEQYNNKITDQVKPEAVITKVEPTVPKKQINLPPANPKAYIAPAKSLPTRPPMMSARRPSLDDVKFVRKLVGPIEELETMTIIDFRRVSPDPVAAARKIKEKINLLEKELYTKRAEGIVAWHKSEVSRFYRLLGQASMTEGRSIEQIIAERLSAGKPTLTLEEFNAIMELNKELRY